MTPIIAVFMSMISLLALVADRASLQEQGEAIPLPSVDDGVSRNFLDVAKRTLPLKINPSRTMTLRRFPRAARSSDHDDALFMQSLIIRALSKRDIREQLFGGRSSSGTSTKKPGKARPTPSPRPRPSPPRPNSLGELRENLMVHGRDRDQLRRRWKIENAGNRVANIHG